MLESFIEAINAPEVTPLSAAFKLLLSMLLGCVVGVERKRRGQMAGMRTFALIAMGATLAMLLSIYVPQVYLGLKNGDPGRIAAQVISGIGFLGAGAIIQMKGSVRGLTTAAGIWMVATIGMAVGVGMYLVAFLATLLVLAILVLLERFEHRVSVGSEARTIRLKLDGVVSDIEPYKNVLDRFHASLNNFYIDYDFQDNSTRLNLVVLLKDNTDLLALLNDISKIGNPLSVPLSNQPS